MLRVLSSPFRFAPWWATALVVIFGLLDLARGLCNMNLGRLPHWYKLLYLRVAILEFGYLGDSEAREIAFNNRRQRRAAFYGLARELRNTYYGLLLKRRGIQAMAGGATIVGSRSGLFWKNIPGGLPVIQDAKALTGNVFFVDANAAQTGTTSGFGTHPDRAIADIESAYDLCTASQGDVVFVLPGHTETVADEITMDTIGISVIGLGVGTARPQVTQNVAGDCFALDAASNVLENIYFNEATTAPAAGGAAVDLNAAHCKVRNCYFDLGADDLEAITATATGDSCEVAYCEFHVTANGPDAAIEIEAAGCDKLYVHHNYFDGMSATNAWDVGGINSGVIHTLCVIEYNVFLFLAANIGGVEFTAAATGYIGHNRFIGGTLGQMLDPGSCYCIDNIEQDAIDESGRLFPTVNPSDLQWGALVNAGGTPALGDMIGDVANDTIIARLNDIGSNVDSAVTSDIQGKIGTDTEMADRSLYDLLNGSGPTAYAAAAAAANGVSLAAVLRYIEDLLVGTAGVVTYPAAAAPANGVALADVLRAIYDRQLGDGTNAAASYLGLRVTKVSDMAVANDALFTVTGMVAITLLIGKVTTALDANVTTMVIDIDGVNMCLATTVTSDALGTLYRVTGHPDTELNGGTAPLVGFVGATAMHDSTVDRSAAAPMFVVDDQGGGAIDHVLGAANVAAAAVTWTLFYIPLENGASVAAAA